ncbi:MAG: twin transmembrane helix small protein [Pseudomonadota bacterium]
MTILSVLVIVGLFATAIALVFGIASMAHGGEFDRRHSHQFMYARVGLQGITLVLVLIALWLAVR